MLSFHRAVPAALLTAVAASLLQLSTGCASTGPDTAQAAVASMSALETSLTAASAQIGTTLNALDQLIAKADADLRPEYDAYEKALDGLESAAESVRDEAARMRTKTQEQYAEWEKSQAAIQDADLKKRSEERRVELQKKQGEANERTQAFQQRFEGFVTKLKDIHTFLGNDLNTAGVESIEGSAKQATSEGTEIRESIGELAAKLAEVRKAISAQGPATPPPEAK